EFVIEKSLNRIKKFWKEAQYEVIEHSSGLKLVREWDVLEQACKEDLEELVSMKASNYYKIFEQDCLDLESKLTKLSEIQVNWVEVQFYWLDLYGILGENLDIQNFLPLETSKFKSLTSEYKMITTRAFQLDTTIEVIHIPNFDTTLKLTIDSLKMIKSSLSTFLERQRRQFPRFYFLGNDDLLKIIGSGKHHDQVSKFMKKMFGSIESIIFFEDFITGVRSVEGEVLNLNEKIELKDSIQAQEWLNILDTEIKLSVFTQFRDCLGQLKDGTDIEVVVSKYIFQAILLSAQVMWTELVEKCLQTNEFSKYWKEVDMKIKGLLDKLNKSSDNVKKKIEALLVEYLHFNNVIGQLKNCSTKEEARLLWAKVQKFYQKNDTLDDLNSVFISQSGYLLQYKFEYIGIPERLIYTPLLLIGFATLTDSLHQKYGGCFFGPAGTGKTETVKAFGQNLGRVVVVFNCDDSFDYQVLSRLLVGITQIGAWGCFDEFNRLDEKVLSAVSANIQQIQNGLQVGKSHITLLEEETPLSPHTAVFITLNPGYNGRSELPENLKKSFREFSMKSPQSGTIAEMILQIMGFEDSKSLASKIVHFLELLSSKCSSMNHYHFGLRTLKGVLRNCSPLISEFGEGEKTVVESLKRVILPSLGDTDELVFKDELSKIFDSAGTPLNSKAIVQCLKDAGQRSGFSMSEEFLKKCMQFYYMQKTQQALILVGKAGCGKTATWKTVIDAMAIFDGHANVVYVIDTKVLTKESLYGSMLKATLEWRDGLFTSILRRVNDDITGTFKNSRIWVVFDSDLDPEYVEAMNSVLDDNKILTLPNGERLPIPPNFRILFETDNLDHTTPATITRCGLLWFSTDVCSISSKIDHLLNKSYEALDNKLSMFELDKLKDLISDSFDMASLTNIFTCSNDLVHILGVRTFNKLETAVQLAVHLISSYRQWFQNLDDKSLKDVITLLIKRSLLYALAGDSTGESQRAFIQTINTYFGHDSQELSDYSTIVIANDKLSFSSFCSEIPSVSLEAHEVMRPDIVIPTIDTIKHEKIFYDLLNSKRGIILCGPPGSGKTMIMNNALRNSSLYDVVGINFSKDTTTEHILSALHRHTNYVTTSKGLTLLPKSDIKNLVLFCDEINLPKLDKYGSQNVVLFLRQLMEKQGFWKTPENKWVTIERIHIVGACNPPTDPGRIPMSERFTRHAAILYLGYPSGKSLSQIYEIYYKAIFKLVPEFRSYTEPFARASVHLYNECKARYSTGLQSHYLFSPRELTRLVRGVYTAINTGPRQTLRSLIRLWAYEAWRIFADRLVGVKEKNSFEQLLYETVDKYLPNQDLGNISSTSLLFSGLLSLDFKEVNKTDLVNFIEERFKTFCDEELEVPMVIHESMVDHILRIDRALKQVQGHMMLIGASRTGKTILTRFVAWLNGLKIVQPKIHRHSNLSDFDMILKKAISDCSLKESRTCLIIDESNILETAFLERMNTLLANADIPDLFQGEEYDKLLNNLRNKTRSLGLLLDTEQELYDWFVGEIAKNLHVVFTICDPTNNKSSAMISSPALFNRCIINWMGDWDTKTMSQVANNMVDVVPMEFTDFIVPEVNKELVFTEPIQTIRDAVVNILIHFDRNFYQKMKVGVNPRSPGYFIDGLRALVKLVTAKYQDLQENQRFVNVGLEKLNESVLKVNELNKTLPKAPPEEKEASISLVKSLTFEKERWLNTTKQFSKTSQELIGNCIISSIYETYFGHLNERERGDMLVILKRLLGKFAVKYDVNYRFIDYLVTLDEKMKWLECGLDKNDYFLENMSIVMNSQDAVPFLLDPSSHMITVISNYYGNKTVLLSFLEEGFVKRLENAVRFGSVVIIQDGEFFDPIISRLISREFNHAGNRVTVEIGDHEVDVSGDFKLFIHSCDPSGDIPIFLRSRVRLVHFVTNKESIETRIFDITLTEENAEMQRKREDLIKLNTEYRLKLKNLEKRLLEELNNSQGNMLENDELMVTLNNLKKEAMNIEKKLSESEEFFPQFDNLVEEYSIIGKHSVKIFSMLEKFGQFHWFYGISIGQFLSCFKRVFIKKSRETRAARTRVDEILWLLYQEVYCQFSTALDKKFKMIMAMTMFCLYKFDIESEQYKEAVLTMIGVLSESSDGVPKLTVDTNDDLRYLWDYVTTKSYISALNWFKNEFFVDEWNIADVVANSENNYFTMASERDVDGTFKLIELAKASKESLKIIPLGSIENLNYAQEEISKSKIEGGWILLQNIQMSLSWVKTYLHKHVEETKAAEEHEKFKMFMTCHLTGDKLPAPLLQRTDRVVYEDIPGILDTVKDLWGSQFFTGKISGVWSVYCTFLLSWFHALITARTRLVPHGFSKKYYFNDCDFQFASVYLENVLATNSTNNIPWAQVRDHIATIVYGGKIDEEKDLEVVAKLCAHVFCGSDNLQIVPGVRIPQPLLQQSEEEERARLTAILSNTIEPADSLSSWLQLPRESILDYERLQAKEVASSTEQLLQEM
uniref:Cytoplasmic dynein heavy chain n=1 Tax=Saccharomyces cerevisiae TaxID=4932 RepID=UPI0002003DB2|nr:Chain A, Cytoplasmic dynein heavy chain [Saccharomyces cerevisiae]3QMZ_B Chain B, Cytoplasmic dynein heavy chain [Saccharomyces cerevisiae]